VLMEARAQVAARVLVASWAPVARAPVTIRALVVSLHFTSDFFVSLLPRLAARVAAADCRARAQAVLPQPSGSRSQTRCSLHLLVLQRRHVTVPEPFSYPARRFLYARDRRLLHSLHRHGTHLINGHRPRGWTSDLSPGGLPQPSRSRSQTRCSLHLLLLRRRPVTVPEPFSYPARRFLYARDRRRPLQPPHTRYPSRQRTPPQRLDL
jgi:hypothetical protein